MPRPRLNSTITLTRWHLCGLLAFAPWAVGAQEGPVFPPEPAPAAQERGPDAAALPPMQAPLRSVRKLSDGELSCAQIYAETQALEQAGQAQQAEALRAQQAMADTQSEMMKQASGVRGAGMGASISGSLLGMIPGGSQVHGYAMQAAAEARRASMQDSTQKMMQAQTRLIQLEQALEQTQARSEHLTELFLRKGCQLSQVKAAGAAAP